MNIINKIKAVFSNEDRALVDISPETYSIIRKVADFTMTSDERLCALINATQYIVDKGIEGSIVECGVWKGGSIMSVVYTLLKNNIIDRKLYLFDTFEGMSEPTEKDIDIEGEIADEILRKEDKQDATSIWCYSSLDEVRQNLDKTSYPPENLIFVEGKVEDTIPKTLPEKIALLRLDTDWYESTKHELKYLFPKLVEGGVIIIDDYGHWQGCRRAVDEYFKENNITILLNRIDYTGRMGIKI